MPKLAARAPAIGQRDPEAEIEMGREHRIAVGAHRVEGDVAEVEQAGETDHDVEAPAQHDVGQHQRRHIDQAPVGEGHEGKADGEHDQDQAEELVVAQVEAGEAVLAGVGLGPAGLGLGLEDEKERAERQRQRHQHHAPIHHPGFEGQLVAQRQPFRPRPFEHGEERDHGEADDQRHQGPPRLQHLHQEIDDRDADRGAEHRPIAGVRPRGR